MVELTKFPNLNEASLRYLASDGSWERTLLNFAPPAEVLHLAWAYLLKCYTGEEIIRFESEPFPIAFDVALGKFEVLKTSDIERSAHQQTTGVFHVRVSYRKCIKFQSVE
jgi:hypothetical protein